MGVLGGGTLLLTPGEFGETLGLADSVVQMDEDKFVTLWVENHGVEKTHLKKGMQLGTLVPVDILTVVGVENRGRESEDLTAAIDSRGDGRREGTISLTNPQSNTVRNEGVVEETGDRLKMIES